MEDFREIILGHLEVLLQEDRIYHVGMQIQNLVDMTVRGNLKRSSRLKIVLNALFLKCSEERKPRFEEILAQLDA